jgi:hypothetical protein
VATSTRRTRVIVTIAAALGAALWLARCGHPMDVKVERPLRHRSESTVVPPGTYRASVDEGQGAIVLTHDAGAIALAAKKRGTKQAVQKPNASLERTGETDQWVLRVKLPPAVEWVTLLETADEHHEP